MSADPTLKERMRITHILTRYADDNECECREASIKVRYLIWLINLDQISRLFNDLEIATDRESMDLIIDFMDDLQLNGDLEQCDEVFRRADINKLTKAQIVAFLGITSKIKSSARNDFYFRAIQSLSEENPETLEKYK